MNSPSSPTSGAIVSKPSMAEVPQIIPPILPPEVARALADTARAVLALVGALTGNGADTGTVQDKTCQPPADLSSLLPDPPLSISAATTELLRQKARLDRNDKYLKNLRLALSRFARSMGARSLDQVKPADVERWVLGLALANRTRKWHLDNVRLLYNFAIKRGYLTVNPAATVELPPDAARSRPPVIHSPAEVAQVLEAMRRADLNVCRALAIRYFAGLRGSELQGITEAEIKLERGFIEVKSAVAKTRRRRLVRIEPNLAQWLKLGGTIPLTNAHSRMARIAKVSGVAWSPGVTRHSFVSYHLAQFESAARTALEAGHSEAMLFAHYRELVTREDAARFWAIVPQA